MALRWLHKTWSAFWAFIGIGLAVLIVVGLLGFGILQLPASKSYIVKKIEDRFNSQHYGVIKLGKFTGTLPVNFQFESINLYPDSSSFEPIISSDTVSATLDFLSLFGNRYVINGLKVSSPRIKVSGDSSASIINAIQKKKVDNSTIDLSETSSPFVEILAPSVVINNGYVVIDNPILSNGTISDSITLRDLDLRMFVDYNAEGRFIDIDKLELSIPELDIDNVSLFGQVFNDNRFLEFNAFNIRFGNSVLNFSGEADGVDLLKGDFLTQLNSSQLSIDIKELNVDPTTIRRVYKNYPDFEQNLYLSLKAEGDVDSVSINEFEVIFGESALQGNGYIDNPFCETDLRYGADLYNVFLDTLELYLIKPDFTSTQIEAVTSARFQANLKGTKELIAADLEVNSSRGSIIVDGELGFTDKFPLSISATLDSLNLGELFTDQLISSGLSGQIEVETSGLRNFKNTFGKAEITLLQGSINESNFDSIYVEADWDSGFINPSFKFNAPNTFLTGIGTVDVTDSIPRIDFSGQGSNLNVKELSKIERLSTAVLDLNYELFLTGSNRNNLYGQISLDIPFSVVGGDTLPNHQFYADFNEPGTNERSLRITSTAFDISMNGIFEPEEVLSLSPYWYRYFKNRIKEEILLKDQDFSTLDRPEVRDQNFQLDLTVKNLGLLKSYFPEFPTLITNAKVTSNFNVNADRILFNSNIYDSKFQFRNIKSDSLSLLLTGSFRYLDSFKSFGDLQAEAQIAKLSTDLITGQNLNISFNMEEDSISVIQSISKIGEDTRFNIESNIQLKDSSINIFVNNFELGSNTYKWVNNRVPSLSYLTDDKVIFSDFTFSNFEEFISIEGTFSNEPSDSVKFVIRSVNLARISELINGRIDFSGNLDGNFTTRSLTKTPTIQGALNILGFGIDNNIVGDMTLQSNFNQDLNRFDTKISVLTDSTKYPDYYIRNQRSGQNIQLDGYVLAPVNGEFPAADSLFSFDLNFENIDLWIIPFIAPKVFSEMSGRASGNGYVWGNLDTYDFEVDYQIGMDDAVYLKPRFLDTYYYGQGEINFSRTRGLDFKDVYVIDPSGGSAIVSGTYDLNDFSQIHTIDLRIQMDEFQFLNNSFDPTIPFFGKAYGSSILQLTGSNLDAVLSSVTPIYISDFSNIGIPLLEETEFDEDNKFIRFVNDFSLRGSDGNSTGDNFSIFASTVEENPFDRTFTERFTLDLQFIASQPMTVQLIFDPITGDIITADGIGRLRIQLQDEEFTMFGQFDISGGNYQFVSGDIFTRRFELQRGGTITWDGSPTDAQLNLDAVYEARPDINTLTRARSEIDQQTSQRVPVQLVLSIRGSLNSIENNFFFRLPNTFETRQNTTLSTQINTLNRNEDEKLIQATSFLLMGDFIPSTSAGTDGTNSLSNNFSGSGAVLNPLLSSQVISPLLSNQINSLLRSDIGSLDIDFNLNTYNNVDLAVALRLYNDRIILSREGQITGAQSNIGDLGATYRINQTFSVTAFHRQDPTFSSFSGVEESQQAQDINGVGLEAEVSFNNWNEFFNKIANPFRRLFGIKVKEDTQNQIDDEITVNQNPPS